MFRRCVAVECQVYIKIAGVGVGDGTAHIAVRVIPDIGDAAGTQVGFHSVRDEIHIQLFVAVFAAGIGIPFLGRRA